MKTWIITIAAVLVVCLLLSFLCYAEFGSFNFVRLGLALTDVMGTDAVHQIADHPERAWLVGTRGGLDAFRAYLETEGWTLRMDEQMGAQIPVEKDGRWDYVYWSSNGMYHKFTWETAGIPARPASTQETEPAVLYYPDTLAHSLSFYPESDARITVTPKAAPTFAYPACDGEWRIDAHPDGTFELDSTHSRLFWETSCQTGFPITEGFCVAGADTAAFLEDALTRLGLTPAEREDMLLRFLPQMQGNSWNLISFQGYSGADISPAPDTHIRVCMVFLPLDEPAQIAPQTLTAPDRTGFTVVEWSGGILK